MRASTETQLRGLLASREFWTAEAMAAELGVSVRTVEPQCLLLNVPAWYLLAWDTQRQAPRTFRLDRMSQLHMQPERFALRAAGSLMQDLGAFFAAL